MLKSKLILGSANFGSYYGLNKNLLVKKKEIKKILKFCKNNGVGIIDTAFLYRNSEKIIGTFTNGGYKVITKLPRIKKNKDLNSEILKFVKISLKRLKMKKIHGLLIHDTKNFFSLNSKKYVVSLNSLKKKGIVKKIGFSIYHPAEVKKILKVIKPDIIQLPYNIIDRRFEKDGLLNKLKKKKIEIHARSVFLQGLLLNKSSKLPRFFYKWKHLFSLRDDFIKKNNLNYMDLALGFVKKNKKINKIIIGINSINQLKEILKSKKILKKYPNLQSIDQNLIIPYKWAIK